MLGSVTWLLVAAVRTTETTPFCIFFFFFLFKFRIKIKEEKFGKKKKEKKEEENIKGNLKSKQNKEDPNP